MFPFFAFYPPAPLGPPLGRPPLPPTCACSKCCQKTPAPLEGFWLDTNLEDKIMLSEWAFQLAKNAPRDGYALEMDARARGYKVYQDGAPCGQVGADEAPGYYCFNGEAGDLSLERTPKERGICVPVDFIYKDGEEHGEIPASLEDKVLVIKAFTPGIVSLITCKYAQLDDVTAGMEEFAVIVKPTIHLQGETPTGHLLTYGEKPLDNPFNVLGRRAYHHG